MLPAQADGQSYVVSNPHNRLAPWAHAQARHARPAMTDPYKPLKNAFGRFETGIALAACPNARGGFTVITINSFTSVSLDPALVLWGIENKASTFADFSASPSYAISILNDRQQSVSERFAAHSPSPLVAGGYEIWRTGAPVLKERLPRVGCEGG